MWGDEISELRAEIRAAEQEWPSPDVSGAKLRLGKLRMWCDWYQSHTAAVLAEITNLIDRQNAESLLSHEHVLRQYDPGERLRMWLQRLVYADIIDTEGFQRHCAPTPRYQPEVEAIRAAGARRAEYQAQIDAVLAAVRAHGAMENIGLSLYNTVNLAPGPEKLNRWVSQLVAKGMLPKTYVLGRVVGGAIEHALHRG